MFLHVGALTPVVSNCDVVRITGESVSTFLKTRQVAIVTSARVLPFTMASTMRLIAIS